jgi:Protein of unknown function (DUF3025)
MTSRWIPDFYERGPAFAALEAVARELATVDWPACDDLNRLLSRRDPAITNASGTPIAFVRQALHQRHFADKYEPRAYLSGEVQFRDGGWHDLFNALVWLTFPRSKARLNARHYQAQEAQAVEGHVNRTPVQDGLTLFDESGVIVASSDAALSALLREHAWKELFYVRRSEVMRHMQFCIFGHGLAEKMLEPFIGVTGRGLIIEVDEGFHAQPLAARIAALDTHVAGKIGCLSSARDLTAVPLLGIPGWYAGNEDESFYGNTGYFRPRPANRASDRR